MGDRTWQRTRKCLVSRALARKESSRSSPDASARNPCAREDWSRTTINEYLKFWVTEFWYLHIPTNNIRLNPWRDNGIVYNTPSHRWARMSVLEKIEDPTLSRSSSILGSLNTFWRNLKSAIWEKIFDTLLSKHQKSEKSILTVACSRFEDEGREGWWQFLPPSLSSRRSAAKLRQFALG